MDAINKKHYFLDSLGLFLLGIFSLGYVIFDRPFAEWNVQLPFLDFPVFIGEILFLLCLCIFLCKGDLQFNGKYFWIIGYFVFVIIKALYGYSKFGPLAFRDAALFYYPAFIIFAGSFYRREFFDAKKNIFLWVVIIFLFTRQGFNEYWLVTCFILAFILSYTFPRKILKYLLLAVLLLATPYALFFSTSRMMIVANFVTGVYSAIGLYLVLKIRWKIKAAIAVLGVVLVGWAFFSYSDKNALLGIVNGDKIFEIFRNYDTQIREARKESISEGENAFNKTRRVRVYNPDPPLSFSRLDKNNLMNIKVVSALEKRIEIQKLSNVKMDNPVPASSFNLEEVGSVSKAVSASDQKKETQELSHVRIYNPDPPLNFKRLGWKKEWSKEGAKEGAKEGSKEGPKEGSKEGLGEVAEDTPGTGVKGEIVGRNLEGAYINAVFRLFIWRDMLTELIREKPILGFHFGKPLRSASLETLKWGETEWGRDGWIAAHNSYLNIIYRAGVVGLSALLAVFVILFKMIRKSIRCRSLTGILLCGIIINWFAAANFLLILELPYTAVSVWTLFGLTYAYVRTVAPTKSRATRHLLELS